MTQEKLNELLRDMSLEEKVGQMIQLPAEVLTGGVQRAGRPVPGRA